MFPDWGIQIFQGPPLATGQGSILFRVVRPSFASATWLLDVATIYAQFSRIVQTKTEEELRAHIAFDRPERPLLSAFNFQLMSVFDESMVLEVTHLVEEEYFRMVEEASIVYHRFIDGGVTDSVAVAAGLAPLMRAAQTLLNHINILRGFIASNPTATQWETTRRFQQLCHDCSNYLAILQGMPQLLLPSTPVTPVEYSSVLNALLSPDRLGRVFEILPQVASVYQANIPVHLDLSPELWEIPLKGRTEGLNLRDVLINLVSNAAKNTEGQNAIDVEARTTAKGLAITVSDHGRGMDDATLGRVYGRYNPHMGAIPGSLHGIGSSSLVESIASYGGRMVVDSQVGEGTSVRLLIPWDALVEAENISLENCSIAGCGYLYAAFI